MNYLIRRHTAGEPQSWCKHIHMFKSISLQSYLQHIFTPNNRRKKINSLWIYLGLESRWVSSHVTCARALLGWLQFS